MKKLIAILTIAIVLVSVVFADGETHKLTVSTTVGEVIPSFQLRYGANGVYTNNTADSNSITNKTYNGQLDMTTPNEFSVADAIDLNQDIAVGDVTADFYAVLAIGGKQNNKVYTLSFSAGAFDTTHNGAADATACTYSCINNIVGTTKQNVVVSNALTGVELSAGNTKSCTITMKGTAAEEKIDLVKFTAKWSRNEDVDVGTYTADVILTITSGT